MFDFSFIFLDCFPLLFFFLCVSFFFFCYYSCCCCCCARSLSFQWLRLGHTFWSLKIGKLSKNKRLMNRMLHWNNRNVKSEMKKRNTTTTTTTTTAKTKNEERIFTHQRLLARMKNTKNFSNIEWEKWQINICQRRNTKWEKQTIREKHLKRFNRLVDRTYSLRLCWRRNRGSMNFATNIFHFIDHLFFLCLSLIFPFGSQFLYVPADSVASSVRAHSSFILDIRISLNWTFFFYRTYFHSYILTMEKEWTKMGENSTKTFQIE